MEPQPINFHPILKDPICQCCRKQHKGVINCQDIPDRIIGYNIYFCSKVCRDETRKKYNISV